MREICNRLVFRYWLTGIWFFIALLWDTWFSFYHLELNKSSLVPILLLGFIIAGLNSPRVIDLRERANHLCVVPVREQLWTSRLLGISGLVLTGLTWVFGGLDSMVCTIMLSSFVEAFIVSCLERHFNKPVFLSDRVNGRIA